MKNIILLLTLLLALNAVGQNLENKIPNNAQIVVGVDGERLLELMSLDEFNNSDLIKKLLVEAKVDKLEDLGFNLNQKAYYFNQIIDDRYYNSFIVYLSDSKKFENYLDAKEKAETINGFNFITKNKFGISWNNEMLIITMASFDYVGEKVEVLEGVEEVKEHAIKEDVIEEEVTEEVEIVEDSGNNEEIVKEDNSIKNNKIQLKKILKKQILSIIATSSNNSIAKNKSYKSGKKSKSSAYFWLKDYSVSMMNLLKKYPTRGIVSTSLFPKDVIGITSVNSNLFFNKDEIKLTAEMSLTKKMEERFEKMYRSKLDCSFFKYFNQDEVLAYMGYSVNMKAMLDEYPKMIKEIYSATLPKYNEEICAAADVFSVLLDEKATAKLITGDALFILNDITEQETTYTTYEYDDDYKRKEVTKTKNETLPIFTVMLGSENKEIIEQLLRLGLKHKVAEESNRIFKFNKQKTKIPFDLYFVIQDDIAFVTNSKSQIEKISKKQIKRNSGKHKRLLRKNLLSFYMNSEKIIEHLPSDKLGNKNTKVVALLKDDFKEMQFSYSRVKHGKFNVEQIIKTNDKNDNSLKTLFNLIEEISKL